MTAAHRWALLLALTLGLPSLYGQAAEPAHVLAPGYGPLQYTAPAAGSYQLPPLGTAVNGELLDSTGKSLRLFDLLGDKLVLMGFIYTHCPDVNGCPLASYVMKQVQARLAQEPELSDEVRLISLSFDPVMDTPAALTDYARHFRRKDADWRFLTAPSEVKLRPILEGFGQWRQINYDANGNYAGSMSHILRVFLIDRERRIRNIYSTGFLHADTVINDLRTLQ